MSYDQLTRVLGKSIIRAERRSNPPNFNMKLYQEAYSLADKLFNRQLERLKEDQRIQQEELLIRARTGKPAPHKWGEKLDDENYFCDPCWYRGYGEGEHAYSIPPCDPMTGERHW